MRSQVFILQVGAFFRHLVGNTCHRVRLQVDVKQANNTPVNFQVGVLIAVDPVGKIVCPGP